MKTGIRAQQGFTLVELLIVVAIIGILAAIAIPQFAAYRMRAFNAVALSDLKNLQKAEWAFFTEWQEYGVTVNSGAPAAGHGNGVILIGPATGSDGIAGLGAFMQVGLSNNVSIVANTEAVPGGVSFALIAKHVLGDRLFGCESEGGAVFFRSGLPGQTLAASGVNMPSTVNVDFTTAGGWTSL